MQTKQSAYGFLRLLGSIALVLSGCGGGGGGSGDATSTTPTPTTPSAITLPSIDGKPDVETILGKDTNNNSVRDEVEVAMFNTIGNDLDTWTAAISLARVYQGWLTKPPVDKLAARAAVMAEAKAAACLTSSSKRSPAEINLIVRELALRTFSTSARQKIQSNVYNFAGAFAIPNSLGQSC